MGNEFSQLSDSDAQHLIRRTGFGAPPDAVDAVAGLTRGQAADLLLAFKPAGYKPNGKRIEDVHNKWINYMIKVKNPLQEKLVLFWHDHFATSAQKVENPKFMTAQNKRLRQFCKGNFRDFMKAMNKDAALMLFLDTNQNRKDFPNENYARELQELFTLGVKDPNGNDNYTQADVVQIARAFTGWTFDEKGNVFIQEFVHDFKDDFPTRGPKVIYKTTGNFSPAGSGRSFIVNGEGPNEIDTVIDIILQHSHVDPDLSVHNTVARRIARRLCEYFAHPDPDQSFVDAVVATSGFATSWVIQPLLRAIFCHDDFYLTAVPAGPGTKKSVKWPVDYVLGTLRLLKMRPKGKEQILANTTVRDILTAMGQVLLEPPSVFGWDWETAWMSSATVRARADFALSVVTAFNGGKTTFTPEKLIDLSLSNPGAIVDAVTTLLGINDQVGMAERNDLIAYLTNNGASSSLNLNDFSTRRVKLYGLFGLLITSPTFQVH